MPSIVAPIITPGDAAILGLVEGITEFLPVSSTGHLILVSELLGLNVSNPTIRAGVDAFEIVIQSGAILAVMGLFLKHFASMLQGLIGRNDGGRALFINLVAAFLPVVVIGPLASGWIKRHLFGPWPVMAALFVGGVLMIGVEYWRINRAGGPEKAAWAGMSLKAMTPPVALAIGLAQCLAMWPGTSRSMVTIVAALLLGFSPRAAAEFSFLLAVPTLLGATAHDLMKDGGAILQASGTIGLAVGFLVSMVVAALAVSSFLAYLNRHGLRAFGYYRLLLAGVILFWLGRTAG